MKKAIGQKYGRLTIIADTGKRVGKGSRILLCQCECGNYKEVVASKLGNDTKSCGCLYTESHATKRDYIGKKFGMLTVIKRVYNGKAQPYYLCKCDCGNTKVIRSNRLGKDIFSCGCLVDRKGKCDATLYNIYKDIKRRCYSPQRENYKNYGGKGVRMCEEWKNDYQTFKKWSEQNGYVYLINSTRERRLSIDRIDAGGHYEPNNCRWIPFAQNRERRNAK